MSDVGVHASGYQRVRDYAESVDRLLLDIRSGLQPTEETVAPVVILLESMEEAKTRPPAVQLLGLHWTRRTGIALARISGLVTELRSRNVTPQTIDDLEGLAGVLDQERADMRLRLRGV
jgi:hypothetical protein